MQIQRNDDTALVELSGRIIFENLQDTKKELESLLEAPLDHIILQMENLDYLDSSALGMLLHLDKQARDRSMRVTMVAPPAHIHTMFACTHLDKIFNILNLTEAQPLIAVFGAENLTRF